MTTAEKLPAPGAVVKLHTLVIYREDTQTLYGFATAGGAGFFPADDRERHRHRPQERAQHHEPALPAAVGERHPRRRCRHAREITGIGKKTAERLVVELRSKVGAAPFAPVSAAGSPPAGMPGDRRIRDAVLALAALGYKTAEADETVRHAALALGPSATTEQLIKKALGR